jgi:hypothetical protein
MERSTPFWMGRREAALAAEARGRAAEEAARKERRVFTGAILSRKKKPAAASGRYRKRERLKIERVRPNR